MGLEWAEIPSRELNIHACLASGQAFRWRLSAGGVWTGVIGTTAVKLIGEEHGFRWQTFPENGRWDLLEQYFALDVDLKPLYDRWTAALPEIADACDRFAGLRILRQGAEETLFSFLCASCNTIVKIRRSIHALAERYGEPIAVLDGHTLYAFPKAEALAKADELALRNDKWGFRAPRVIQAAQFLQSQSPGWLESLRQEPRMRASHELESLAGIGTKIADCIALFGLWHDDAVPIDTHVRQVAERLFMHDLAGRSLTPSLYQAVADRYRKHFGSYAGWAQQYLFFGELKPGTTQSTGG